MSSRTMNRREIFLRSAIVLIDFVEENKAKNAPIEAYVITYGEVGKRIGYADSQKGGRPVTKMGELRSLCLGEFQIALGERVPMLNAMVVNSSIYGNFKPPNLWSHPPIEDEIENQRKWESELKAIAAFSRWDEVRFISQCLLSFGSQLVFSKRCINCLYRLLLAKSSD